MGRMLDALRRVETEHAEAEPPSCAPSASRPASDAGVILVETEEIPFIEVGPQKSMEASPSVLACTPSHSLGVKAEVSTPKTVSSTPLVDSPRKVQFRALPSRIATRSAIAPELVAYHTPDLAAARPYRDVLDAVLRACPAQERSAILLFSAALPRCGNTTTLLNLAVTAANQEQMVLVVDANLQAPGVAQRLGLASAPGLREALAGSHTLDDVIQPTELKNLFALTAGVQETAGVRFAAASLRSLLRQLRQRYPLVFVDAPFWDGRPESTALASACDAVFLVMPQPQAETPRTDALLQLLPNQGIRLAGCILVAEASPVR